MSFSLDPYNDAQKKAITHVKGPLLVISGAGTGKTHVLIGRVLHLLDKKIASPSEILALTFTEKATQEMLERVTSNLPIGHEEVWIKTFHGFCDAILREKGFEIGISTDYKLLSPVDAWLFLKQHVLDLKLDYYRSLGNPQKFLSVLQDHFSRLQDEDITPEDYVKYAENLLKKAKNAENKEDAEKTFEVARAYAIYENLLLKNDCLDFSGLIFYALRMIEKHPSIKAHYQDRFKYILVDEFQDTNFAQNKLIILLSQKQKNLFVVGDDDQSIYKWRGASLTNIEYFNKIFGAAKKIVLVENYRNTQKILDASYSVIQKNNPNRLEVTLAVDKKLIATRKPKDPQLAEVNHFDSLNEEARFVVERAKACLKKGLNTAILVRTNALAKPFLEELKKTSSPFQHFSESDLLNRLGVKDCIAFLKVIVDPWDDIALFRCLTLPFWEIPMEDLLKLNAKVKETNSSLFEVLEGEKISDIKNLIQNFIEYSREKSVSQVLGKFLNESGYIKAALKSDDSAMDDIAQFSEKITEFEKAHEHSKATDFLAYIQLLEESGLSNAPSIALDPNSIKVLTIHAAKGLEFDAVFVPGLVQYKFPSISRRDPLEVPKELIQENLPEGDHHLQEERRLFYVACTRARDLLYLSYSNFYDGVRQWKPSVFISEILESGKAKLHNFAKKNAQATLDLEERPRQKLKLDLPKLSYSQLDAFGACPLKYKFRYLIGLPSKPSAQMSFGVTIHNTLKEFYEYLQKHPEKKDEDLEKLLYEIYEKNWIKKGYETRALQSDMKKRGIAMLKRFYKHEKKDFQISFLLEKPFTLKLDEITLAGRIDRIDRLPDGTYEVIDYKTGENKEKNLKNDLQISVYALACRDALNIPVSKFSLYYLETPEKESTTRDEKELDKAKEKIIELAKKLAASDFSPTPGYHCRYCDYRLVCPAAMVVR